MTWSSTSPLGSVSVKANLTIIGNNTSYIENTMGNSIVGSDGTSIRDHFWAVDANLDGRHRFIQSPVFTIATIAADPTIGASCDAALYLKNTNSQPQWFTKSSSSSPSPNLIYQATPNFLQGTFTLGASFTTVVAVPANVYGEIFIFRSGVHGSPTGQWGFFKSDATQTDAYSYGLAITGQSGFNNVANFANGSSAGQGLNIQAIAASGVSTGNTWSYRVIYRAQ